MPIWRFLFPCLTLLLLEGSNPPPAGASDWKPIDPDHLALKTPQIQPDADAEALLWEVRISDGQNTGGDFTTTFDQYLRVKIFTDRGRETHATVDIPYASDMDVRDVAARTVRPDGSILELKKSDVYRRTVVKANDVKVKVVSFAVPGIEPGVIVEYRWREVYRHSIASNLRLRFSREIPAHDVRYYVRPLAIPDLVMVAWPFNGAITPPAKQPDGFSMLSLSRVRADVQEEYGLPPYEQRPWVFISYDTRAGVKRKDFGAEFGKALFEDYRKRSRPNDEIRRLAAAAVAGRDTDVARVDALVRLARSRIRRHDLDTTDPAEVRAAKRNRHAAEALERGAGNFDDVLVLTLALMEAAGLEARIAAVPNRADLFQRSVQPHPYFIRGRIVAVRSGEGWIFADPANEYAADGHLPWQYEDQRALIADPKQAVYARTPLAGPEYSVKRRTGSFRLTEDGTLEGDARIEYTGHWAEIFREQEDQDAASERETDLRELIQRRLPGAEITDIRIEHVTEADRPYVNAFRVRIPGYAQRTGTRLLLQPALFQKGATTIFKPVERTSEVYFDFPWTEEDVVRIELPAGHTLEEPARPAPFDVGSVAYDAAMTVEAGTHLVLKRTHTVGKGGAILFPPSSYRALRAAFDAVHQSDSHTLVLRRQGQ